MATDDQQPFPLVAWLEGRSRLQRSLALVAVALYGTFVISRWAAAMLLERWWFAELDASSVWSRKFWAQVLLATVAAGVSVTVMLISNHIALTTSPRAGQQIFRPVALVSNRLGPAKRWLAYALPVVFAWMIGAAATSYWKDWLTFRAAEGLGRDAPEVGYDLSYHLFRLPLLDRTTTWLLSLLTATIVMALVLHILRGSFRLPIHGRSSSPRALHHLAALGAAWMAIRAIDYWFVKYPALASTTDGRFDGAGYAMMHGPGLAYRPLAIASLATAVALALFAFGRIRARWGLIAVLATAAAHVVLVILLPPALHRYVVLPAEADREEPYLEANYHGTRMAYGLTDVTIEEVDLYDGVDPSTTADRVPLFDSDQLAAPFQILQGTRGTRVTDVDLDRYDTGDGLRPVYIASRDSASGQLPEQGWVQQHLVYTHGDGLVATTADEVTDGGGLDFDDLQDELGLERTELYYGPGLSDWYALVSTKREEAGGAAYSADNGVAINSVWRRLVIGLGLGDYNVAVSSEFTPETQLLYRRALTERINAVAPFLALDGDPYPVIADGHIVWVVDAYTTANTYPYAQFANTSGVSSQSQLTSNPKNYVRQSAVVTVDGYDGSVHVYRRDRPDDIDPVLEIWNRILPDVIEPADAIPEQIATHLSFGTDGFTVQTNMAAQYHVDDAETLFDGTDAWLVSSTPGRSLEDTTGGPAPAVTKFEDEDPSAAWSIYRSFSPGAANNPSSGREELAAIAIGDHLTGELRVFRIESRDGRFITSPTVAQAVIAADPDVSQLFTLLNANGSKVYFGQMIPVVTDDGLAWIRTIVVVSSSSSATPRLYSVLAVSNGVVGIGSTVNEAIAATAGAD